MKPAIILGILMMLSAGCANPPSFQGQTTVLGLELETAGSVASAESPLPKLRFGLIHHQSQIIQQSQAASMYSAKSGISLWTASGSIMDEYSITPSASSQTDSGRDEK